MIDLELPIFKHWGNVFREYGFRLIVNGYYSSNYSTDCISIIPKNIEESYNQYHYPCLVHGRSTKGFGIKVKHWKNLGNKFNCENSEELNKLLKHFINELNTGKKSKRYIQQKKEKLEQLAEELSNLYLEWEN